MHVQLPVRDKQSSSKQKCIILISNLFFHELGKKETENGHIKNANITCIIFADHSEREAGQYVLWEQENVSYLELL